MRLELHARPELRTALVELVTAELHAQIDAGAQELSVESAKPKAGEALRVIVKSDVLSEPKVLAVRE